TDHESSDTSTLSLHDALPISGVAASVMVPNCGVFTKRSGVPRLTWFKALKNSARNWNLIRSTRLNSRASAKSIVWRPGPMTVLRSEEHTSELQSRGHLVCRLL